jgi:hypothetical protein
MQYIIYPNLERNGICLVVPSGEIPVEQVALKDVPAGLPYKIFSETNSLPDNEFFDAWEADFSNPDGYGIGHDAWVAQLAAKETNQ